jgi:hypothetical protein
MIQLPLRLPDPQNALSTHFERLLDADCDHISPSDKIFLRVQFAQLGFICQPMTTRTIKTIKTRFRCA